MSQVLEHFERNLQDRRLLHRGDSVLVAVSGGVDSMVLLQLLDRLSGKWGWKLRAAHFNHRLRGRASEADQEFVSREAKKRGLPCSMGRADVRAHAKRNRISIEMAARRLRHAFLARVASKYQASRIALAHHADDQVELFFLRLFRGSSPAGLAGMTWIAPSPAGGKARLVRPLLDIPKSSLLGYARAHRIAFREDATNDSLNIQRNRIRHELLPLLRLRYQPAVHEVVSRLMDILGAEAGFLAARAEAWLKSGSRKPFTSLPVAVQRQCIRLQLMKLGITADYDLIEKLRQASGVPVSVCAVDAVRQWADSAGAGASVRKPGIRGGDRGPGRDQIAVRRDRAGKLHVESAGSVQFDPACSMVCLERSAQEVVFEGLRLGWELIDLGGAKLPRPEQNVEFFDADRVGRRICLRHWRAGDRFQPIGFDNAVKLQDIFTNEKVPRVERHRLVVATTAQAEVFWVEGLRISEQFKLSEGTRRRLKWCWERTCPGLRHMG